MSTERQEYSLSYQRATIASYAERNNFSVVKTYSDPGRSGLWLRNRPGLMALLRDVVAAEHGFDAILVYDVSRWGRFQDADEGGHYEFLCKSNGVPVHYCAEPFTNENTLPNIVFKTLKRTMAAEYSRELSMRVTQALRYRAEHGCWTGGQPGYGLRRMMISGDGKSRQILQAGDQKGLRTATVTLVLGPQQEVEMVRSIYDMLLRRHLRPKAILRELQQGEIANNGRRWSFNDVKQVLTNPKYAGVAVWGRSETKLSRSPRSLPPDRWIVKPGAFPQIISMDTFARAQKVYYDRTNQKTNAQLLDALRRLWKEHGYLGHEVIDASAMAPSVSTYRHRFGSLAEAFRQIGYRRSQIKIGRLVWRGKRVAARMRKEVVRKLTATFARRVIPGGYEGYLRLPDAGITVEVNACPLHKIRNHPVWNHTPRDDRGLRSTVTLLCLMDRSSRKIQSYYVLPRVKRVNRCRVYGGCKLLANAHRLRSLREFYRAVIEAYGKTPGPEPLWEPDSLVGVPQIARYLKRSESMIWRWIRLGMPIYRQDRLVRASPTAIREWARENGKAYVSVRDRCGRFASRTH